MIVTTYQEIERNRCADLIIDHDDTLYAVRIAKPARTTFDSMLDCFPLPHLLAATDPALYASLRDCAVAEWLKRDKRRTERRFWTCARLERFNQLAGGGWL